MTLGQILPIIPCPPLPHTHTHSLCLSLSLSHTHNTHTIPQPYKLLQWGDMSMGVNLLLFELTGWTTYGEAITAHMDNWIKVRPYMHIYIYML
jgi:hypothetical protein